MTWCRAKTESVVCSAAIVRVQGEGFGAMPAPKLSAVSRSVRAPKVKVPAAPSFQSPWYSAPTRSPMNCVLVRQAVSIETGKKSLLQNRKPWA